MCGDFGSCQVGQSTHAIIDGETLQVCSMPDGPGLPQKLFSAACRVIKRVGGGERFELVRILLSGFCGVEA